MLLSVFELDGYQSTTVRDALDKGTLQNLEFIKVIKNYSGGIDEDASGVDEFVQSARLRAKKQVTGAQAHGILKRIGMIKNRHFGGDSETQVYIRIRTGDGQIRRFEIHHTDDAVLEETFVHNEMVSGFKELLKSMYAEPLMEMVHKLTRIGDQLCGAT